MAMMKKPVTGMKDILPAEMQIRDYLIGLIKETYRGFGFTPIETPCVESIENLCSKQGGENEKLIFKILKRGEKLHMETAETENDLVDTGLRYDLTLPLVRYYSNNAASLPSPFKALQIGSVWRADRPQKGRFRQFTQCDIDILGEPSNLAEIELILATTTCLGKIGFSDFTVRINDRRILKAMASYSGFAGEDYDKVFIILDKMDKIGMDGVAAELAEEGFPEAAINKYTELFRELETAENGFNYLGEKLAGFLEQEVVDHMNMIRDTVLAAASSSFRLVFDPTLVRGMSYYTGTIFEIGMEGFSGSVAGGGRYDEMVGKFTGQKTCACGFSIGFERIVTILLDRGYTVPGAADKQAILLEKGLPADKVCSVMKEASQLRAAGKQVLVATKNKNVKFQKEQLAKDGYLDVRVVYKEEFQN